MAYVKQISTLGDNAPDIYYGESADDKPTENIKNPSFLYEKDTAKLYAYCESNSSWVEQ